MLGESLKMLIVTGMFHRIYIVHDEVKDKSFELELSWICEQSKGRHERVPANVFTEAETYAKAALAEESDSDNDD